MSEKLALIGGVCLGAGLIAVLSRRDVSDETLVDRVRSRLPGAVSYPESIGVSARQGCVVLSGPVPVDELADLLASVGSVQGIKGIESRLDVLGSDFNGTTDLEELSRQAIG